MLNNTVLWSGKQGKHIVTYACYGNWHMRHSPPHRFGGSDVPDRKSQYFCPENPHQILGCERRAEIHSRSLMPRIVLGNVFCVRFGTLVSILLGAREVKIIADKSWLRGPEAFGCGFHKLPWSAVLLSRRDESLWVVWVALRLVVKADLPPDFSPRH